MAFTQEEIKAMEPRVLEGELAIALLGLQWWAGQAYGGMGTLHRGLFAEKPEYIPGARPATGEEPLYSDWHWLVPKYTTWGTMPLVVAAMIAQGWQWSASCGDSETDRVIFGKIDKDEQGKDRSVRVRLIDCPNLESVPIVTCQAALWALQPWANNEIMWVTEFPDLSEKSGFNGWERANNL